MFLYNFFFQYLLFFQSQSCLLESTAAIFRQSAGYVCFFPERWQCTQTKVVSREFQRWDPFFSQILLDNHCSGRILQDNHPVSPGVQKSFCTFPIIYHDFYTFFCLFVIVKYPQFRIDTTDDIENPYTEVLLMIHGLPFGQDPSITSYVIVFGIDNSQSSSTRMRRSTLDDMLQAS